MAVSKTRILQVQIFEQIFQEELNQHCFSNLYFLFFNPKHIGRLSFEVQWVCFNFVNFSDNPHFLARLT
jgi:hypothetical protein